MKFKHLTINCQLSITQLLSYSVILSLILFFSPPLKAQVTIGSLNPPHSFSVLELTTEKTDGGLRLPQLKTSERLALNSQLTGNDEAKGLTVYDTDLNCLEFWNGTDWVSMCSDVLLDCSSTVFPVLQSSCTLCAGATFADLITAVGGKERWYDTATGGAAHSDGDNLTSGKTYYAEELVGACVSPTRAPVAVTTGDCSIAPTSGNVTTFTDVMYDFQSQTLQAYARASGGIPTKYEWQVSTDNVTFTDIPGAPNSNFFTVPPHFADSYLPPKYTPDSLLYFQCLISNPAESTPIIAGGLNILFIQTEKVDGTPIGNYSIDPDTKIRYLTIQKGLGGNNTPTTSGTMKIALLNLGQSGTGGWLRSVVTGADSIHISDDGALNDAGDLGDFYQWGRVKDGHEHIVWKKGTDYKDSITPMSGSANATSAFVDYKEYTKPSYYTSTHQVLSTDNNYYGKFIYSTGSGAANGDNDWYYNGGHDNYLWGNGSPATRPDTGSDITLSQWSGIGKANNPCPGTWSVPSRWNFWDIFNGNGSDSPTGNYSWLSSGVNTWQFRLSTNNAIGGTIITNNSGEKVFLPAAGRRAYDTASLSNVGTNGYYWCSSISSSTYAYILYFYNGNVTPGNSNANYRAYGFSIRCVAE